VDTTAKKKPGVKRVRHDEKKECKCTRIYPTDLASIEAKYGKLQVFLDAKLEEEFGTPPSKTGATVKV
jgi:hypothetical protein